MPMRGPIYLRGMPQELREYMRHQFDKAMTQAMLDALLGSGECKPMGMLDMSRTNLIQTRTDDWVNRPVVDRD